MNRILAWFLVALIFAMSGPLQAATMASARGFEKSLYGRSAAWADKYAYCGGDPINRVDPLGLEEIYPDHFCCTSSPSLRVQVLSGFEPTGSRTVAASGLFRKKSKRIAGRRPQTPVLVGEHWSCRAWLCENNPEHPEDRAR